MFSVGTLQQPNLRHGSSSNQPGPHDGGEGPTTPVVQEAPSNTMNPPRPGSPPRPSVYSKGWECLINRPLTVHERTSLISTMLSDRDEVSTIEHLCNNDTQDLIDIIYEVRSRPLFPPRSDPTAFDSNSFPLLIRRWAISTTHCG